LEKDLAVFKAMSDETRLRILLLLSRRELCVCEIVAVLDMPQGKVSRHLSVLRHARLVTDRREGLWIYYSLRSPETPLIQTLTDYLETAGKHLPPAVEDQSRLEALVCDGEVCVPNPSPALVQTSVSGTP
jgi:ArsR family transcriptional regulator